MMPDDDDAIEFPVTEELDLHTFRPRDIGELIPDYFGLCLEKGITTVRIVHGKGSGTLRETVHAILRRDPRVVSFHLGDQSSGGWGATVCRLREPEANADP